MRRHSLGRRIGTGAVALLAIAGLSAVYSPAASADEPSPLGEVVDVVDGATDVLADVVDPSGTPDPGAPAPPAAETTDVSLALAKGGADRERFTITLTVKNSGPAAATNVQLTGALTQLTATVADAGGFSCAVAQAVTCSAAQLAPGATATITVHAAVAEPTAGKQGSAQFTVAADKDSNGDNNKASTNHEVPANFGGIITGTVWHDRNKDGAQNADENGISSVQVHLTDGGDVIGTVLTGQDGSYTFSRVLAKNATLVVGKPSSLEFTTPDAVNDTYDSDVSSAGTRGIGAVGDGAYVDIDAGLRAIGGGGDEGGSSPTRQVGSTPTTTPPVNRAATTLPKTGVSLGSTLAAGVVVLLTGFALVTVVGRRRRS